MGLDEIIDRLNAEDSVHGAYVLDEETLRMVVDEESQVTTTIGMPMENRAMAECLKRSTFVCVFCEYAFEVPTDHVMIMVDGSGNIMGHDIPRGKAAEYAGRTDVTWLSDDFVMYPDAMGDDIKVVMLPQDVNVIGEREGAVKPVMVYPSTTTDIILKKRFGVDAVTSKLASALLAFDLL